MNVRTFVAFACVGLLLGVEAASAESASYSLTVKRHKSVVLTADDVDRILRDASALLKRKDGANDVACNVTFKRNGPVETFESNDTPVIIKTAADRDAVHREKADVKVVKEIDFCIVKGSYEGCTWPPELGVKSMIVTHPGASRGIVWAHEFGHRTGLRHRNEPKALMSFCDLRRNQVNVNRDECDCFLKGPGECPGRREPSEDQMQCLMSLGN